MIRVRFPAGVQKKGIHNIMDTHFLYLGILSIGRDYLSDGGDGVAAAGGGVGTKPAGAATLVAAEQDVRLALDAEQGTCRKVIKMNNSLWCIAGVVAVQQILHLSAHGTDKWYFACIQHNAIACFGREERDTLAQQPCILGLPLVSMGLHTSAIFHV